MTGHKSEKGRVFVAVIPLIMDKGSILLQLRQGTGYRDGYWDLAGTGHMDKGETPVEALVRECQEELGISLIPNKVRHCHTHYVRGDNPYIYLYFAVTDYQGIPTIKERHKSAQLAWYPIDDLPTSVIPNHMTSLLALSEGLTYSEGVI